MSSLRHWAIAVCVLGCSDADGSAAGDPSGAGAGASTGTGEPTACEATLRLLQKDAYKEVAGRTSDLWPPHTTTALEVVCDGEVIHSSFQANHGTEPGALDPNGDVFLVEVKTLSASGTRSSLEALAAAYDACQCDGTTKFLSLDSLDDATAQALVDTVSTYLEQNLQCPGGMTDELVALLTQGDIPGAIAIFQTCTWVGAASFEEGLDEAMTTIAAQAQELLTDYHVCNNDAVLQRALFEDFVATGATGGCMSEDADVCFGPLWLYVP